MTSIGIVLPEKIYVTAEFERKSQSSNFIKLPETVDSWSWHSWVATIIDSKGNWKEYIFSDWEKELIERLNKTGLAT
jgi:NADH:ubiquinone oxidoreductase subunit